MSRLAACFSFVACITILAVGSTVGAETMIQFDYSYDTSNFFGAGTPARTSLEAAGGFFESVLQDDLDAIIPRGGANWWRAVFSDPTTGDPVSLLNPTIPADTLVVYVGARDLGGSVLGLAGAGGVQRGGSVAWQNTVQSRGEGDTTGTGADDFGPWGGGLAVDQDSTWNLDHTLAPSSGQNDLFSVVLHELAHVLGVGTADSWDNLVVGSDFTGAASVAEHGGNVPLDSDLSHWAAATMSQVYPQGAAQRAAMGPGLSTGTRKLFTDLDVAALDDVGWEIVPEPSTLVLAAMGLLTLLAYCHRRRIER